MLTARFCFVIVCLGEVYGAKTARCRKTWSARDQVLWLQQDPRVYRGRNGRKSTAIKDFLSGLTTGGINLVNIALSVDALWTLM